MEGNGQTRGMPQGVQQNGSCIFNGITNEMRNNPQRQTYGPITLSNGAIYTGELLNGMKDGYGQQVWQDGSKYDG